jgi:hypothetical protein
MQDARVRVLSTLLLSIAAYSSVFGAIAAFAWWLVFSRAKWSFKKIKTTAYVFIFVALVAAVTQVTGGDGISYLIRFFVILLVAGEAFGQRQGGELLETFVWLFGKRWGFDLGLIAEMVAETIELAHLDAIRVRNAMKLKSIPWGIRTAGTLAATLIHIQLRRSKEQAAALSIRGYRKGGNLCPRFNSNFRDKTAFFAAFIIALGSITRVVMFL